MGLDHACGGVCACSTCHVIVHEGLESCNEADRRGTRSARRSARADGEIAPGMPVRAGRHADLVVEIPEWNKNFAKEAEH